MGNVRNAYAVRDIQPFRLFSHAPQKKRKKHPRSNQTLNRCDAFCLISPKWRYKPRKSNTQGWLKWSASKKRSISFSFTRSSSEGLFNLQNESQLSSCQYLLLSHVRDSCFNKYWKGWKQLVWARNLQGIRGIRRGNESRGDRGCPMPPASRFQFSRAEPEQLTVLLPSLRTALCLLCAIRHRVAPVNGRPFSQAPSAPAVIDDRSPADSPFEFSILPWGNCSFLRSTFSFLQQDSLLSLYITLSRAVELWCIAACIGHEKC